MVRSKLRVWIWYDHGGYDNGGYDHGKGYYNSYTNDEHHQSGIYSSSGAKVWPVWRTG